MPMSRSKRSKQTSAVHAAVKKTISAMGLVKPEKDSNASKEAIKALIMSAFAEEGEIKEAAPVVAASVATVAKPAEPAVLALAAPSVTLAQIIKQAENVSNK
jgi:hypothetical protein